MNIEYYEKFEKELEAGLKKQAATSVKLFVESFKGEEEVRNWVWSYLPNLEKNRHSCIRYEIFINLVYPTLKRGFEIGDYDSTLWLGKLIQNIYQTKGLFEELGSLVDMDFYKRCHEIDPENNHGNSLLLDSILNWFSYCEHEWPAGILYGNDGASIEQCEDIRNEAKFALSLVTEQADKDFIEQFLEKLIQYETRIIKALKSDS
ncbi:hypothetical protein [Pseudoalteromonas umbrosa]|uniref:hypothetical protein n=1 Tax=Pseudoalteromonas umbrosa TaxID=3048489 RepID=UPI0024C2B9C4|nr:hypothetical protein [Pseudoalteromonas sp. B95]MDK1285721.1 hypothetical protein [Pseudoalteromonas sp. B95]